VALAAVVGVRASVADASGDASGVVLEGSGRGVAALFCDVGDAVISARVLGGVNVLRVSGHKSRPTVGVGESHAADTNSTRLSITTQPRSRMDEW
jgi:hypothetical protein